MLELLLAASLITTPPPPGRPEAECIKEHSGHWGKITECISPSIDLNANPLLKKAHAACSAAIAAAKAEGTELTEATIIVAGIATTCTAP